MAWSYLAGAIVFEVFGTLSIKQIVVTNNYLWVGSVIFFYLLSFSLMTLAVRQIEIGVAYAIWAGMGTALIVLLGWFLFHESISSLKIIGVGMIILGVVLLKLEQV